MDINEGIVFDLVRSIDTSKSSALDRMSSNRLKDALLALIPHIMHIFKQSIKTETFPDDWKIATVIPIFKNGDKSDVSNYRPISLLPIPEKIFEDIIHTHISNYLENIQYISNKQNGFRKNYSSLDGIDNFTTEIFNSCFY